MSIQQTTRIIDGLRATAHGYWSEHRITPLPYGERLHAEKLAVAAAHEELFTKLIPHNPLIAGFLTHETAADIHTKSLSIGGHDCQQPVDETTVPEYATMVTERIQDLKTDPLTWPRYRPLIVAFPVGKTLDAAKRNRAKILASLPASWDIQSASCHDMAWVWNAAINRGVRYMPPTLSDMVSASFDDGARRDKIHGYNWFKRPAVIKITPDGGPRTYQIVLKAVFPIVEMEFPGGTELFKVFDANFFHVDWAIRCRHKPYVKVVSENTDVAKLIESNVYETALEPSRTNDDAIAQALLSHYDDKIALTKCDSVEFTVLVAVGGSSLAEAEHVASLLAEVTGPLRIKWKRIAGLQQEKWSAMLPGNTAHHTVTALADETTIPQFAEMVPFTSFALGSPTGPIFGRNIKSGLNELFRINTRAILANNQPANLVLLGGLGVGKTTVIKTGMIFDSVLGHLFAGFDRTEMGELAKIAEPMPGRIILDVLNPTHSIDALKTFKHDPALAGRHTLTALVNLMELKINSEEALVLSEILTKDVITADNIASLMRLQHVMLNSNDPVTQRVGRHLRMWANYDFTKALFDPMLPPADYSAPAFIIRTYGMPAASAVELHEGKRLTPEKLYMEGVYEVTGQALRHVYFSSPKQCSIYLPEAWHLTRKPIGQEMIEVLGHDSRKAGCVLWMDTHLGKRDFIAGQTDLIGIWMVGHTEAQAARDNIACAGLSTADNPEFLDDITSGFDVGQFLVRFFDQVGAVQTLLPSDAVTRRAMDTTFRAFDGAVL